MEISNISRIYFSRKSLNYITAQWSILELHYIGTDYYFIIIINYYTDFLQQYFCLKTVLTRCENS